MDSPAPIPGSVPLPSPQRSEVAIESPGAGHGYWAGAPSACSDGDNIYLAYRLRRPIGEGRGYAVVIAHSGDGVRFRTAVVLHQRDFDTDSLERPALVRLPDGRWRVYVSSATPNSLHWRLDAIDADTPADFRAEDRRTVLPGDEETAYKDPVVSRAGDEWHMWICRHLIRPRVAADAMSTVFATSADGLAWDLHGVGLAGRPGMWDARGARVTAVLPGRDDVIAYYDGRATSAQNWEEQTGIAVQVAPGVLTSVSPHPAAVSPVGGGLRYLSVIEQGGGYRLYYEVTRADGAHDLRTEYAPLPVSLSQSAKESPVTSARSAMSAAK
jgi:hypothetical protein